MKQTVYFIDKSITFSDNAAQPYDLVIDSRADTIAEISRAKVVDFFEKYNSILFLCNTPQQSYDDFCREFRSVKAAGGLVHNSRGECLMMLRNGRWDLPKGHLERGETLEECALREVEEECGVEGLKLCAKITETQHAYILNEEWAIKTTHWYSMQSESEEFTPQTEEGIECVEWCTQAKAAEHLAESYPTIRAVFDALLSDTSVE